MEMILILAGVLIGAAIAWIIFYLLHKIKSVSKVHYDQLKTGYQEASTSLRISEDRLLHQQQENAKHHAKIEGKETELASLHSRSSALETMVKNDEQKIAELIKTLAEQTVHAEIHQKEVSALKQLIAESNAAAKSAGEQLHAQKEIVLEQATFVNQLREQINRLTGENSTLTANNKSYHERLSGQKEEIAALQQTAHLQFEKIASQILEEKSGRFTEMNRTNMEALLKPLGENIDIFKKKVEETYDKESKQRFSLEEKVRELIEQTNKVSTEANNLATALKGQTKKQGNWGEVILESILQKSGLVKDREYFIQKNIKNDDGKNLRPDVLINLPDNRVIIVDSKVSLIAYDRFSSSDKPEEMAIHLGEHLRSIHRHIDDLHGKNYDNLETALDFTMMFIPIEPAYLVAIQADQELWAYAYAKRILLISPTNLIACLKLIADLWKREMQSKNAMEIVKRGELLYEKFVGFAESMEDVGRHIHRSQSAYDTALLQLKTGSGNLVGQALKLKSLGLKSGKEIPNALLPLGFDPEEKDPASQ